MKLIIPSVFAAALVSSASANCETVAAIASLNILNRHGCNGYHARSPSSRSSTCRPASRAIDLCKDFVDRDFRSYCVNLPSHKKWDLMDECDWEVLQN
ncbi:hypothetical protein THAOC_21191, partial [Thalassiosira oceanica]